MWDVGLDRVAHSVKVGVSWYGVVFKKEVHGCRYPKPTSSQTFHAGVAKRKNLGIRSGRINFSVDTQSRVERSNKNAAEDSCGK